MLYLYKYLFNVSYQLFSKPGIQGHIHAKEYNWFNIVFLPSWELLFCKGSLTGIFFLHGSVFLQSESHCCDGPSTQFTLLYYTYNTLLYCTYNLHIAILYV